MELNNYIHCYPNLLHPTTNLSFYEVCKSGLLPFEDATIIRAGEKLLDKDFRSTKYCHLAPDYAEGMTRNHWSRYFRYAFQREFVKYDKETNCTTNAVINDIQVLKYTPGDHFNFHFDDGPTTPRTLSGIYFVNDDYEGGDLIFKDPKTGKQTKIKKEKNLFIVWPSNFLYFHTVTNVTKGERYSVVVWAR